MTRRLMLMLALMLAVTAGAAAQSDDPFPPALNAQMDQLVMATETLRELSSLRAVERAFPTREDTIAFLTELYSAELPDEEADRQMRLYVALDLLPPDLDLRAVYLTLLGQQVAGFYDTESQVMNVIPLVGDDVGDALSLTEEIIFVHEYTHALQDQYFDIDALMEGPAADSPDATLALVSLLEGDATAVMQVYLQEVVQRNPLAAFAVLAEGAQAGALTLPPGIPDILATELLFPYETGLTFVLALYREGGWDALNAAYANPPTTTEQILNPAAYLAGEGAQTVTLPDYAPVLGEGWTQRWDTTLGQFYIREFLAMHLSDRQAADAAQGWGGDRFALYTSGDDSAWALRLRWDTLAEQTEFTVAMMAYLEVRFGAESAPGCWSSAAVTLCFAGGESLGSLIVGAPDLALAQTLIAVR